MPLSSLVAVNAEDVVAVATEETVLGRVVRDLSTHCGTYGMGGPGFLGLLLDTHGDGPSEWLILTLWGAGDWVSANGRWITANLEQYAQQRPWTSYYGGDNRWDELSPLIVGKRIQKFDVREREFEMVVGDVRFTLVEDASTRPIFAGSREPRILEPGTDLRQGWILARTPAVRI